LRQTTRSKAITTPFWDGLLCGGLSIIGMGTYMVYMLIYGTPVSRFDFVDWIVFGVLVNSPHFMASYRVLYTSRGAFRRHRASTLYVPIALLAMLGWAASGPDPGTTLRPMAILSSVYLAWHWTGQAWGMVATFSRLGGLQLSAVESWCVRSGTRALLMWHVLWTVGHIRPLRTLLDLEIPNFYFERAFEIVSALAAISFALGVWAFLSARRRGQPLPLRVMIPWFALYVWYGFWYLTPGGMFFVQFAHALQYLAFPLRVEMNRYDSVEARTKRQDFCRLLLVYLGLVVAGACVLGFKNLSILAFGSGWYSEPPYGDLLRGIIVSVNIHHYFIDGAMWKLRNPEVRRELFRHIRS
jgi:hypothetical protein